jgi:alkylation response protein AidB-like acyl-CoA dehydrogenase
MVTGGYFLTTSLKDSQVFTPEKFSDIQNEFAKATREFALQEILPQRDEIDKFNQELSLKLMKAAGGLGLLGVDVPEKYGGLAIDKVTSAMVVENITRGRCASFTVTISAHTGIGTLPIVYFGTEEQKQKYLPKLTSGEWLSAYALTEPGSGSDALSIRTSAELSRDKKYYILNGNKQFISNGGWADILITFAKIDGEKLTAFILDPKAEGITQHEEKNKLGLHGSSTSNIILENLKVPVENVLGVIGEGAEIAFNSLNIGRFKLGAAVLGGCKNAVTESMKYALERKQFGQPIAHFDAIKKKIADMMVRTFALESIIYETANLLDQSIAQVDENSKHYSKEVAAAIERFALECSICKVYGSETYWQTADDGLQIFGGYGFIEEYPMARALRDTRVDRIYEGTNEINRQIILGYVVKKTLLEELPVREKIKETMQILNGKRINVDESTLAEQQRALEYTKHLTLYLLNKALIRYGQDLLNEQQVGEILSDMIIEIFLMNTTLSRIEQILAGGQNNTVFTNIAKVLIAEGSIEICGLAKRAITHIENPNQLDTALKDIRFFENQMDIKTDIIYQKQEIADFLYRQQKYPF